MDLTIKQLASRLKISRPTVEVRMNHIPGFRNKYTKKKGNKIMINETGCKLISKTKTAPHHNHRSQATNHQSHALVLKVLHNQNLEQSNMIKNQGQTIKKLTKLLDQQQQLQLATQSENKHLKNRVKKLTHVTTGDPKVLAFNGNHKHLSNVGKITKPKAPKVDKAKQAKVRAAAKKTKSKKQKKARHRNFWHRFFGK